MSKIIEALKAHARDLPKKEESAPSKSGYEMTQEQLAEIYFSGTGKSVQKTDPPVIIKVIERPRMASLIPWIIASVAFLITAFSLFSTKRIFVDIHVVEEKSPIVARAEHEALSENTPGESSGESYYGSPISFENTRFEGAARLNSSAEKNGLTLVNSSVSSFARANVNLPEPLSIAGSKIVFYAKGYNGGENIAFAMKDRGNVQAFAKGKIFPFPALLTTQWQKAEIPVGESVPGFDPKNVTSLRFEFGSKDTDNKPGDTVFVKDLRVVPL